MSHEPRSPTRRRYLSGYLSALGLTLVAFAAARLGAANPTLALGVVIVAGLIQIVVHLRYFLHLGFGKSQRENLVLVLIATLLISLMVGGSVWIMFDLNRRMM